MDRVVPMLHPDATNILLCHAHSKAARAACRRGRALGGNSPLLHPASLQLRNTIPYAKVLAEPAEEQCDRLGQFRGAYVAHIP